MGRDSKYTLLNDVDWLRERYTIEGKSTVEIANIVRCSSPQTVCQSLRKHGIHVRSKSEGHLVKRQGDGLILDDTTLSIITGCLLGDGFFSRNRGTGNPQFRKNNIYYDHQLFVAKQLFGEKYKERISGPFANDGGLSKNSKPLFHLRSLVHPELLYLYDLWYPESNEYKKIIPENIPLNSTVLLHWFLDDGYSYKAQRRYPNPKYNKEVTRCYFCTQSFRLEELSFLCERIKDIFCITMKPRFHQRHGIVAGTGYEIEIWESCVKDFFDIIGPSPVNSLSYKWK